MAILSADPTRRRPAPARRLALGLAAAVLLTGAKGTINPGQGKQPINWEARSFALDYQTHLMHLRGDVKISQGEISVAADEAEATSQSKDSRSSHWVFTGNVHVRAESQGDLRSDRATVEIVNNELASALVTGSPAQFEQTRSTTGQLVKGHATTIDYDVTGGIVKLTGDAWLTDDHNDNDIKAPSITYNVRDRQIKGESASVPGGRVHMVIVPKGDSGPAPAQGTP